MSLYDSIILVLLAATLSVVLTMFILDRRSRAQNMGLLLGRVGDVETRVTLNWSRHDKLREVADKQLTRIEHDCGLVVTKLAHKVEYLEQEVGHLQAERDHK